MRFLFVLDELPYPPRNGVTIPTFNWISRLSLDHHVSLLYVKDDAVEIDHEMVDENRRYVENLWVIERSRASTCNRIKEELIGRKPFFLGWSCDMAKLYNHLNGHPFDIVWGSPLSVTEIMDSILNILGPKPIYVAGINDCNTSVLRALGKKSFMKGLNLKTRVLYVVDWLRSLLIGPMEARILKKYDLILVQTDIERKWLIKISSGKLNCKTLVLSNGVNETLFGISITDKTKDVLFLASAGEGRNMALSWVVNNVWPKIRQADREIKLTIVGKNIPHQLLQDLEKDTQIIHIDYIKDICDLYRNKAVLLAPIFKGYGLINKVIESMAAGVPVIGDSGSFNGIPDFVNGCHGIIANDAKSMAAEILGLLNSSIKRIEIAHSARSLVKSHFSWNDRINQAVKRLESIKGAKSSK